jgi:hypothetical protein
MHQADCPRSGLGSYHDFNLRLILFHHITYIDWNTQRQEKNHLRAKSTKQRNVLQKLNFKSPITFAETYPALWPIPFATKIQTDVVAPASWVCGGERGLDLGSVAPRWRLRVDWVMDVSPLPCGPHARHVSDTHPHLLVHSVATRTMWSSMERHPHRWP